VLEREIERLSARVTQLEDEKARVEAFAAVAAHELIEPLVMTEAYVTIVSERLNAPEHADSRRDLNALGRGVVRIRMLTESLLFEASASERPLERRPVDVSELVSDLLSLLRPEIAAREAHVTVKELPGVHGEEALLTGVFTNLLINALKYGPRKGSTIVVGGSREGALCRYYVESDGPTIPAVERARIFEPFQRGPGERRTAGAGLGLAICRRIVDRHGGDISVVPLNGVGNRFQFRLPV
jgi:signal transduction histidine kinase